MIKLVLSDIMCRQHRLLLTTWINLNSKEVAVVRKRQMLVTSPWSRRRLTRFMSVVLICDCVVLFANCNNHAINYRMEDLHRSAKYKHFEWFSVFFFQCLIIIFTFCWHFRGLNFHKIVELVLLLWPEVFFVFVFVFLCCCCFCSFFL